MQQQEIISPTSTLSDSEILIPNDTSSSSLDHEVRLSNAQQQQQQEGASSSSLRQPVTTNSGGGVGGNKLDRDMTEDEVAIMVKNALRKARRAMNNSSPLVDLNDNSPTNNNNNTMSGSSNYGEGSANKYEDNLPSPISDEIDFDKLSPPTTTNNYETSISSTDVATLKAQPDILAKRIEKEIQSARAFAERKYNNDSTANKIVDNNVGADVNMEEKPSAATTPENSKQRARENRRAARRSPTNIVSSPNNKDVVVNPTPVKTPGKKMYDAMLQVSPARGEDPQPKFTTANDLGRDDTSGGGVGSTSEGVVGDRDIGRDGGTSPNNKKNTLSNDPDEEFEGQGGGNSLMVAEDTDSHKDMDNKEKDTEQLQSALSQPNTNSNKPQDNQNPQQNQQQHRQVLFRHPYPLPPPPHKPRPDSLIITNNCPPTKQINIKWVNPDVDLQALIEAAGEQYNLVRRSNACGAIKVLASKDSNKLKLCRTTGLLNVLISASYDDAVDSDALDARTRAVTTLLYLSEPKDNRLIIAKHDNCSVLDCLVKVIKEDTGEARWRATSALATLAKTPSNRGIMGNADELCSVLANLMVLGVQRKQEEEKEDKKEDDKKENEEDGVEGADSRTEDDSTLQNTDSMTQRGSYESGTYDEEDGPMLTNTFSGTFTEGSTFSEDMTFDQSAYDSDTLDDSKEGDDDDMGSDQEDDNQSHNGSQQDDDHTMDEENSVQEEEGVEMQISSLKKLNIENASDFLSKSQLSACATLTHLTKYCANAPSLCNNDELLNNIIFLAGILDNPLHTRCIEMLCNFTRFPSNNTKLANMPSCIDMLLLTGKSKNAEDRMWSIRTIQNLCSDAGSKVGLATGAMLSLLSTAAMRKDYEEQYAAVGALMNLSTEPGSIVPLTNTKTVVATLVHLAHSPNTPGAVRKIACDSLATIGLWLQTLASAGTVPEEIPFSPLPTHSATGWLRWDN